MEKNLIMVGIIDEEGFELSNRVYARGGTAPTITSGNGKIRITRKYEKETNHSRELRQEPKEEQ